MNYVDSGQRSIWRGSIKKTHKRLNINYRKKFDENEREN